MFLNKNFVSQPFSKFQRDLYKSIDRANDTVITHIKKPIALKNAITKKILSNARQKHATHTLEVFIQWPFPFSNKLFSDNATTSIKKEREPKKTAYESDFEMTLCIVSYLEMEKLQASHFEVKKYNASDFALGILQRVRFLMKNFSTRQF